MRRNVKMKGEVGGDLRDYGMVVWEEEEKGL